MFQGDATANNGRLTGGDLVVRTLSHYQISPAIGAGGMGEVYQATTKLGGQREAQVLASLNHPNITSIYGLDDCGGVYAPLMEPLEGRLRWPTGS